MRDFIVSVGDSYEMLTKAALLLESRSLRYQTITFPDGTTSVLAAVNKIAHGGTLIGEELGALLYYIADIMENTNSWK